MLGTGSRALRGAMALARGARATGRSPATGPCAVSEGPKNRDPSKSGQAILGRKIILKLSITFRATLIAAAAQVELGKRPIDAVFRN